MSRNKALTNEIPSVKIKNGKEITTFYHADGRIKRRRVKTMIEGESETQQQFLEECDVNRIMAQANRGMEITHLKRSQPIYMDMTQFPPDYQAALEVVKNAEQAFNDLPSAVRTRFQNQPDQLIEFLSNNENHSEAISLGLIEKKPEPVKVTEPPIEEKK